MPSTICMDGIWMADYNFQDATCIGDRKFDPAQGPLISPDPRAMANPGRLGQQSPAWSQKPTLIAPKARPFGARRGHPKLLGIGRPMFATVLSANDSRSGHNKGKLDLRPAPSGRRWPRLD